MTDEEALKTALAKVEAQQDNFGFMDRFTVDEHWAVRDAIEKRMPKPLNDVSVFGGARCGECYTWIDKPDGINYCPYCGQRICWEEDETC